MGIGIFFGLLTAVLQVSSYFFSRLFLQKYGKPVLLLAVSEGWIALFSLAALPFFVTKDMFHWKILPPLMLACFGFLIGHYFFFRALKSIESSRIASIMGLKVIAVPGFLSLCFGYHFTLQQWIALFIAMTSAMLINYRGGKLFAWKGLGNLLVTIPMYAWSDIGIALLIEQLPGDKLLNRAITGSLLNNIFTGVILSPLLWKYHAVIAHFKCALPYSFGWGMGVVTLFICFSYLNPAFANVIQASRGPLSLIAGIILAYMGWNDLEERVSGKIWFFRAVSTLLMTSAILLYAFGK